MSLWNDQNEMIPDFGGLAVPNGSVYDKGTSTQKVAVGQRIAMKDGRVFRYAKANGTITAGAMCEAVPNEQAISATYFGADSSTAPLAGEGGSIGDTEIRLTDDVSGVTADEYAGGYLQISDATGEGYLYRIKGNEATSTDTNGFFVTLFDGDGLRVALDQTSVGSIVADPLNAITIATAADPTVVPAVGRAMVALAAGEYGWIQTWGICNLKAGVATIDVGEGIILAEDDDGSVQVGLGENVPVVGDALTDAVDTAWAVCRLTLNP